MTLAGMMMLWSADVLANTLSPILVTLAGMVILVSAELKNAL